jgi:hypothetical protein
MSGCSAWRLCISVQLEYRSSSVRGDMIMLVAGNSSTVIQVTYAPHTWILACDTVSPATCHMLQLTANGLPTWLCV